MENIENKLDYTIGQQYSFSRVFSQQDVIDFAQLSHDDNPIHLDQGYAEQSVFKQCVVHGMLVASMFSKIFGTIYPGKGSIYLGQTIKFSAPVFINDIIMAQVELKEYSQAHKLGVFQTVCTNQDDKIVLTGQAKVLFP